MADNTGHLPFFVITAAIGAVAGAIAGGVIAARNGKNVWAGIGIGAAAGALIGTGAGMAAGAALAGSITATTGMVTAGATSLVVTISTGGLGAGVASVANNLSQATNNLSSADPVKNALKQLDSTGLRPGQTEISRAKVMDIVNSFDITKAQICYSGEFCLEIGADNVYMHNNNNQLKEDYQTDNGFYYGGKIVLTDHVKTVEYDLQTNNSTEFLATSYEYPTFVIEAEIVDHHTILFSKENKQKILDIKQAKQDSNVFKKLYELEKEKNWQGNSYLSELFDKVQVVNNQIYIICRVINWDGETHAVVFQYDYDTNSCKYAFHCFMDDIIGDDLYVVPII